MNVNTFQLSELANPDKINKSINKKLAEDIDHNNPSDFEDESDVEDEKPNRITELLADLTDYDSDSESDSEENTKESLLNNIVSDSDSDSDSDSNSNSDSNPEHKHYNTPPMYQQTNTDYNFNYNSQYDNRNTDVLLSEIEDLEHYLVREKIAFEKQIVSRSSPYDIVNEYYKFLKKLKSNAQARDMTEASILWIASGVSSYFN